MLALGMQGIYVFPALYRVHDGAQRSELFGGGFFGKAGNGDLLVWRGRFV